MSSACNFGPSGELSRVPQWTGIRCRTPHNTRMRQPIQTSNNTSFHKYWNNYNRLENFIVNKSRAKLSRLSRLWLQVALISVPFMVTNSLILSRLWSQKQCFRVMATDYHTIFPLIEMFHGSESLFLNRFSHDCIWFAGRNYYKHFQNDIWNFDDLLTVHLSLYIPVINQLDAQNFCFTISLFHASTCFEHMCSSSGGKNCIIQPLVSSHLYVAASCTGWESPLSTCNAIFTSWWWAHVLETCIGTK